MPSGRWVQHALTQAELGNVQTDGNRVSASSARSLRKNRWAAEVIADVSALPEGSEVTWRIEMAAGTKHFELLDSIAELIPEAVFDDRGIAAAVERLGKASRMFGRKEVRHLHNVIRSTEEVVELGQGRIGDKQGIVVLTTERLFFFERSMLGSESTQEFALSVIQALNVSKKLGGERIEVAYSGTKAEITNMQHGQADSIVRAFHRLRRQDAVAATPPSPTEVAAPDPIEQLKKLAQLRDQGILTPEEFEAKKTDLLSRM